MEEIIELIVKVKINYPNKSRRQEAIKRAKECVLSGMVLGTVGCKSKSAKLHVVVDKPKLIECDEWLYKGCFIQKSEHVKLIGKYEVFKNDSVQTHVGRCHTFTDARKLCEKNECFENTLIF